VAAESGESLTSVGASASLRVSRARDVARKAIPVAVACLLFLLPVPEGLPPHAWRYFAIFTAVVAGLVLEPIPGPALGLVGVSVIALTAPWTLFPPVELNAQGFNAPSRAIDWALSGFSNNTVWLAFAAFMFGTAYDRTGLGKRIALSLVRALGRRTLFLGYAVMLSDIVLAPFIPSNTARSAGTIFPIIRAVPLIYDSKPNDPSSKKIGGYLLWIAFATSCVTSSLFLTALAPNLLAVEFARRIGKVELTWIDWFLTFAPIGVPLLLLLPLLSYVLYPPTLMVSPEAPEWARLRLKEMGPPTRRECATAVLACIAIFLWIFGSSYINPTTVALSVVAVMLLVGIVAWDDVVANHDAWRTLTLLATLVTLADGLYRTGFVEWFSLNITGPMVDLSPRQIIMGFVIIYFLSHYMFASLTAHATAMLPILLTLGLEIEGIDFKSLALHLGATQGIMAVLTPYASGPSSVYAHSGYIGVKDYWRLGTVFGMIFLIGFLAVSAFIRV
jgi:L-tartrate/succinate antiporter